jgi:hypothetical protein
MAKQLDPKEQERAARMHAEFVRNNRGSTLRVAEVDGVAHPDTRDIRKRILDAGRTYPRKTIGSTLEQKIAEREAEIAADKLNAALQDPNISEKERQLLVWKRDRDKELDAEDAAERVKKHLQQPRNVKLVTEAKLLRERIVNDSSRELAEVDFADLVVAALSDPDAEPHAAQALLVELRDTEAARIQQAKFERMSKIAALQGEIEQLQQRQVTSADSEDDLEVRAAEREQATREKFAKIKSDHAARFERAMELVDQGQYDMANKLMDGADE